MRYRLRTLLIVLAIGPPFVAAIWSVLTAEPSTKPTLTEMSFDLEEWSYVRTDTLGGSE